MDGTADGIWDLKELGVTEALLGGKERSCCSLLIFGAQAFRTGSVHTINTHILGRKSSRL